MGLKNHEILKTKFFMKIMEIQLFMKTQLFSGSLTSA